MPPCRVLRGFFFLYSHYQNIPIPNVNNNKKGPSTTVCSFQALPNRAKDANHFERKLEDNHFTTNSVLLRVYEDQWY